GYHASKKGPPVMPVPQSGNFCHNSNDWCHDRSRSDVEVSIRNAPRRICPSSCVWVNVYAIRSFTACGAHRGAERIPMSTMVIRIGFRDAMNAMTLRISNPAAKKETRDDVAMSAMIQAASRSSRGGGLVTAAI